LAHTAEPNHNTSDVGLLDIERGNASLKGTGSWATILGA
jgi:hypothetical protein